MTMRWPFHFLTIRPVRAVLEAFLVGTILWSGLLLLQDSISPFTLQLAITLLIGFVCMLLYALRLRLPKGSWRRQGIFEATAASVLGIVFSGINLAFAFVLLRDTASSMFLRGSDRLLLFVEIVLTLNIALFIIFRIGVRLLLLWNRLRRKQLLWALTHAHIMVLALGAGLVILLLDVLIINIPRRIPIVPVTGFLVTLSVIALVIIVPPLALFSSLVVRRTTSRLKTLAAATSVLRDGNYAIRVPVVGEDEVAQLQTDFNAMAAALDRAMHQLQEERDTVAGLLQARRELIVNVSHELRTPVATLRSYLETTLSCREEPARPTFQHDLQVMENEVIRLQGLIEDLFLLSRAEVGRLTLRCEPTNVEVLVQRIVETAAPLVWRASRIELVADIACELPRALVDASRLEQVLQNLLHNGVRHTSPGGIVAVMVRGEAEAVVLQVKDTGEGIALGDLPHIWERFYQTESTRTRMDGGTGLGLALVKEWIEGMNGTVAVESVLGEGSCFTISLPRTDAAS